MKYAQPKSMALAWKEYGVDLGLAMAHINELTNRVKGYTGSSSFILWLTEDLSSEEHISIGDYWDSLSPEHDHCKNYKNRSQREAAGEERKEKIKEVKLAMVSKTWAGMNPAERKLCMGLDEEVSDSDLQSLLE